MDPRESLNQPKSRRRRALHLPCRRVHVLVSALLLSGLIAVQFLFAPWVGSPDDAEAFGLIDPQPDPDIIQSRLGALSIAAKDDPGLISVGFACLQTINAVKGWAATLAADSLVLVSATASLQ